MNDAIRMYVTLLCDVFAALGIGGTTAASLTMQGRSLSFRRMFLASLISPTQTTLLSVQVVWRACVRPAGPEDLVVAHVA